MSDESFEMDVHVARKEGADPDNIKRRTTGHITTATPQTPIHLCAPIPIIPHPPTMPAPEPEARRRVGNPLIVAGSPIVLNMGRPQFFRQRRNGERGPDKKRRRPRRCKRCVRNNGEMAEVCIGRTKSGEKKCQYFNN